MRLTNRERIALLMLLVGLAGYLVYTYVVPPQEAAIGNLRGDLSFLQQRLAQVNAAPARLASLETQLEENLAGLEDVGGQYFSLLEEQEGVIILMNELFLTPGIKDLSFGFSPVQNPVIAGGRIEQQTVNVTCEGSYESVWALLHAVWGFDQRIIISSLTMRPQASATAVNGDGQLSVQLSLELPDLSELTGSRNSLVYWFNREDFVKPNPFTPLPGETFYGIRFLLASSTLEQGWENLNFVDIEGHWAEEAIETFRARGLVFADSRHRFFPNSPISRGELVVLLDGYFAWPLPDQPVNLTAFSDYLEIGSYEGVMARAVFKGFLNGYIVGYTDGTLRPHSPVSYREFRDIMRRVLDEPGFTWEQYSQLIADQTGHVSLGNNAPSLSMTRAEAVYFLHILGNP